MTGIDDLDIAVLQNDVVRSNGAELVSMMQAQELDADFWCLRYDENVFPDIAESLNIFEYGRSLSSETLFSTTFNTISPALTNPSFLQDYDVVICHQDLTEILAYRAKERYGVGMIWYMHNVSDLLYLRELSQSQGRKEDIPLPIRLISRIAGMYLKPLDRKAFQTADRIFTNSRKTIEELIEPVFGSREKMNPLHPPIRDMRGENENKDYVLVVSRVAPYKDLKQVLEEMRGRDEKIKFAGSVKDEAYKEELKQEAEEKGLEVEFLGFVPDNELGNLISGAKFGIYPSDDENFGLVPLEMVKAGTPCFVRQGIGATEVLPDEYCLPIQNIPEPDDLDLGLSERHYEALRNAIEDTAG
ncbi:MAG: glycosyltransferase family 4 protein [Candidatus Nanohalobium sp.]